MKRVVTFGGLMPFIDVQIPHDLVYNDCGVEMNPYQWIVVKDHLTFRVWYDNGQWNGYVQHMFSTWGAGRWIRGCYSFEECVQGLFDRYIDDFLYNEKHFSITGKDKEAMKEYNVWNNDMSMKYFKQITL